MKCGDCKYWAEQDENDGECRKYSPRKVLAEIYLPDANSQGYADMLVNSMEDNAVWPLTHESYWCGEFKPI